MKIKFTMIIGVIALLLSFCNFSSHSQVQSTLVNSDFEMGDFQGWQAQLGDCCPINCTPSAITPGRHTIVTTADSDPATYGAIPCVCPDGGLYSARLGNWYTGSEAEKLSYKILEVDSTNALFVYRYAVILQDPGHSQGDQPRFEISIVDTNGVLLDSVCGHYMVYASAGLEGFETTSYAGDDVVYRNWTWVGINLEPYIGEPVVIEFATGDCALGGHFGYAYIDAYSAPMKIDAISCDNTSSITFTAPPGFYYEWSTGDTTQSIEVINPQFGQSFTCTLTTVSNPLCQLVLTADVSVVNLNGAVFDLCEDESLTFPLQEYSGAIYNWTGPNNFTSNLCNPVIPSVSEFNEGEYHLTMIIDTSCISNSNMMVYVTPKPIVNLGPDTTLCTNDVINYNLGFNQNCTFHWHADVGAYSFYSTAPTMLIDKPGTYSVTVTNPICPPEIDSIVVEYNEIDLFLGNDILGACSQTPVTLNATTPLSGYPSVTYHWTNGATTSTITAPSSGMYYATVTRGSCIDIDGINVQYTQPPVLNLPPSMELCVGSATSIDPGFLPYTQYHWSTGVNTQILQVTVPGTYRVTVTNSCGSAVDSVSVLLTYPPSVNLGSDTVVCSGQVVYLDASYGLASYLWSNNMTTPAIAVYNGGYYAVTVTNECGSITDGIVITTESSINPNLGPDSTVCPGYILDPGFATANYVWSNGATTQQIAVYEPGTYSVEITNTCGVFYSSITLDLIQTVVNIGSDTTICPETSLTLDAGSGVFYYWSTGSMNQTIEVNEAGLYDVAVSNLCGTYYDTIAVSMFDNELSLGNDTVLCFGETLTLDAEHPGSEYEWSTGENTQTIEVGESGEYSVHLSHYCGVINDTISVNINPPVTIDFGTDTIHADDPVTLDAGSGFLSYHWSNNQTTQTIIAEHSGYFSVTVTDEFGCHGSDIVYITFLGIAEYENNTFRIFPNPANDIISISSENSIINKIEIFDCIGNLVVTKTGNSNRASIKLNELTSGLFFIRIESSGKSIIKKLNIIR